MNKPKVKKNRVSVYSSYFMLLQINVLLSLQNFLLAMVERT